MAGIYIHIPFCRKACHYCDFHFSTSLKQRTEMVSAILSEIAIQQHFFGNESIETIYFGGGTPSLLSQSELFQIFELIYKFFDVSENVEITLEANPDDLSLDYLIQLKKTPVNRLSIGVQSFIDEDLLFMNRAHNASQSLTCIENSQKIGFNNITIDLIYGTPTLTENNWMKNLKTAFDLDVPHLSCYCLTVEGGTALYKFVQSGQTPDVDENKASMQFLKLMETADQKGFLQYEISNFCLPGHYSKHNSNYWKGRKYLGIGPSAHSFNGNMRQHNISNNTTYIKSLREGVVPTQIEELTETNRYNEYLLTSLRTMWGTDANEVKGKFGKDFYTHLIEESKPFLVSGLLNFTGEVLTLTREGKLLADHIAKHLFA